MTPICAYLFDRKEESRLQDEQIVELFWTRNEEAIQKTREKYDRYLLKIAYNILDDVGDCEESVSDVYLKAWNSIPPHKPKVLRTYLSKLTRRAAVDTLRKRGRDKRRVSEYTVSLTELEDCLADKNTPEQDVDLEVLSQALGRWLRTLSPDQRNAFIGRYYYSDPIREIAEHLGMSEAKTKTMLYRLRVGLRAHLEKEDIL